MRHKLVSRRAAWSFSSGLLAIAVLALPGCGGGEATSTTPTPPDGALAVVSGIPPTKGVIADRIGRETLGEAIERTWVEAEAGAMDVAVPEGRVETAIREAESRFPSGAGYRKLLAKANLTRAQVHQLTRLRLLRAAIGEVAEEEADPPSKEEIAARYDEVRSRKFERSASRDVRAIVNENPAKLRRAMAILRRDNSPESWEGVAERYSIDPAGKESGGLALDLTPDHVEEPLSRRIFSAPIHTIVGIVPGAENRGYVFEVVNDNRKARQTLAEVRPKIQAELEAIARTRARKAFAADFESRWRARTTCAPRHLVPQCANYEGGETEGSKPSPEA